VAAIRVHTAVGARDAVDAVVVGAGPNGLAAAVALAMAGHSVHVIERHEEIGGGTRTAELTLPGLLHDVCSAVHPTGIASPFFCALPLTEHGLHWAHAEIDLAHPLDDGSAGVMVASLQATVAGLGDAGPAWQGIFGHLVRHWDALAEEILQPLLHVPRHPLTLARFGLPALLPATTLARRLPTEQARALFAGVAAHALQPLERPTTAGVGLLLTAAGHAAGWPVAVGGSRAITDALASLLRSLGGTIETGTDVTSLAQLPRCRVALFDVAPGAMARIAGERMPRRVRRAYLRYRHGPAAFKVDLAVDGGIPWTADACRRAGTVHLGGTMTELAAAEREVAAGRLPERPFVLVAQQYLADPSRSVGDVHPVWTYAHVPAGFSGNATDGLLSQLERFAPGTRERIVGMHTWGPADFEAYNPNYVGGDIATGQGDPIQAVFRPRFAVDPYATGIPGVFLCSAATPPGAGVHGMAGFHAAQSALRVLRRSRPQR